MNINDIISMLSPEKSNNFLNDFIQTILTRTPKTYDFDEGTLRSEDNKTGMMVPPNWIPRPKPRIENFEDLQNTLYGSDACAKCRAAQAASMRNGVMNIAEPCRGVCG